MSDTHKKNLAMNVRVSEEEMDILEQAEEIVGQSPSFILRSLVRDKALEWAKEYLLNEQARINRKLGIHTPSETRDKAWLHAAIETVARYALHNDIAWDSIDGFFDQLSPAEGARAKVVLLKIHDNYQPFINNQNADPIEMVYDSQDPSIKWLVSLFAENEESQSQKKGPLSKNPNNTLEELKKEGLGKELEKLGEHEAKVKAKAAKKSARKK